MSTSARYWREIPQRYRLEAGRCTACGAVWFPPRLVCAQCGKREFETVNLPDRGTVKTFTVIRVPPSEFSDQAPYAIGIIELEGGVRLQCQIADCDPQELTIGMPVRIEFRKIKQEGEAGIICYGYKAVPVRDGA
ncbi:MAG TPA: Zn-ribbon domain-containing OB-fold protein [Firmicutes bacterium]|nr:Zn-ribbon domain-containing OB-fold protein [Bacillota bacterium]